MMNGRSVAEDRPTIDAMCASLNSRKLEANLRDICGSTNACLANQSFQSSLATWRKENKYIIAIWWKEYAI